jgi:hypothetical protein
MITEWQREIRREALYLLLMLPDELCMPHRGNSVTVPRDPTRAPDLMKRDLGTAYVEHRRHDYGQDISGIVSITKTSKLRLVSRPKMRA